MTVIKSTRDYQNSDSLKHINWRLLARALPMKVNIYEDILPKSIHILFDGESFSENNIHEKEMELAISVIASEIVSLQEHEMKCYLSICKSYRQEAICIPPESGIKEALYSLASYTPLEPKRDSSGVYILKQKSEFDVDATIRTSLVVGHFFYFTYDRDDIDRELLSR